MQIDSIICISKSLSNTKNKHVLINTIKMHISLDKVETVAIFDLYGLNFNKKIIVNTEKIIFEQT